MYGYSPVLMLVFWIGLLFVGVYLILKFTKGTNQNNDFSRNKNNENETPIAILQKRLAKGEIDETQYERLKNIIIRDES